MWVNNKTFHTVGYKYHKQYLQYPATFCNVSKPYDEENHVARYHFLQCPNAEFAKKYNLMHVLLLFCAMVGLFGDDLNDYMAKCGAK
mgnify:CR=1 FL=1